ncbi:uncharacterized protein LOC116001334 [Ipomoea triloba]|uniref:uncharacterized protein LOC116001334 n=1 Tax=Ipomoea triloba TaxID=35885 RepID=UPI00125D310B|nr:uncharacterized protein LOC116001334 [Ipomoea triloba]
MAANDGSASERTVSDVAEEFLPAVSAATSSTAAARVRNPAFVAWSRRDQGLLSLLVSSLSEEVLSIAVGCRTSKELWDAIEQSLASASQSRQLHLLSQLHGLRQGDSSTAEYLGRARLIVEDLALAGRKVTLEEQNLYVFRGLRPEFKDVTSSLAVRGHPVTLLDTTLPLLNPSQNNEGDAIHADVELSGSVVSLLELADLLGAQDFIAGDDYALPGAAAPAAFAAQGGRQSRGRGGGRSVVLVPVLLAVAEDLHGAAAVLVGSHVAVGEAVAEALPSNAKFVGDSANNVTAHTWLPNTGATHHATPDIAALSNSEDYVGNDTLRVGDGYSDQGNSFAGQ